MVNFMTWVDALYTVHDNMRSHIRGAILFGTGVIICTSSKQNLNIKISTESEVIGASNLLIHPLHVRDGRICHTDGKNISSTFVLSLSFHVYARILYL